MGREWSYILEMEAQTIVDCISWKSVTILSSSCYNVVYSVLYTSEMFSFIAFIFQHNGSWQ